MKPEPDAIAARLLRLRACTLGDTHAVDAPDPGNQLDRNRRVVIFAGGAESMSSLAGAELRSLLERALIGYDGIILSCGTAVGLPGVVGDVAATQGLSAVGYVPKGLGDPKLYPRLRETTGETFTVGEPLAMWADVLGSGIPIGNVRLVACPGGAIAIAEILLARSLGARVAWVDPAGEATEPLYDLLPLGADDVLEPPFDPMTIRAFLSWSSLEPEVREPVARCIHAAYRRAHRKRKAADDPALAPWDELIESLKQSNYAQADDIPNKLALVGKRLVRHGDDLKLTDDELELLAEVEHGRFNIERLLSGWQLGDRRVAQSVTPYLKPWDELADGAKDCDREAVRTIGSALREAGWGVTPAVSRTPAATSPGSGA